VINTPDSPVIGAIPSGLSTPGSLTIGPATAGTPTPTPANYLFIQNDTATAADSPWHVKQIDHTHYEMPNATEPRNAQYIGVFQCDGATDAKLGRLDNTAKWTAGGDDILTVGTVQSNGQVIININEAGTATLTVEWGGMKSILTITAKAETFRTTDQ